MNEGLEKIGACLHWKWLSGTAQDNDDKTQITGGYLLQDVLVRTWKLHGVMSHTVTVVITRNINQYTVCSVKVRSRYLSVRTWANLSSIMRDSRSLWRCFCGWKCCGMWCCACGWIPTFQSYQIRLKLCEPLTRDRVSHPRNANRRSL